MGPESRIIGILGFFIIVLGLLGSGRRVMRLFGVKTATLSGEFAVALAFGMAVFVPAVQLLGWCHLLYRPVLWGLALAGVLIDLPGLRQWFGKLGKMITRPVKLNIAQLFLGALIISYLVIFFVSSLAPVINQDAEAWHYNNPKRYINSGCIHDLPDNLYTGYPWAYQSLILLCLGTGGETAANLLNWLFTAGTLLLFLEIGARYGSAEAGPIMGIMMLGLNLFHSLILPGFIDIILLFLSVGALNAFIEWLSGPKTSTAAVTGLFLGLLAASKYSGLLLVVFILFVCAGYTVAGHARTLRVRQMGVMILLMLIITFPFEGVNIIKYRNPTYPFLNKLLTGEMPPGMDDIASWRVEDNRPSLSGGVNYLKSLFSYRISEAPRCVSFSLILFPFCFLLFMRRVDVLFPGLYAISHLAFAYIMMPTITRYLVPAVGAMILITGISIGFIRVKAIRQFAAVVLTIPFLLQVSPAFSIALANFGASFGKESTREYLSSRSKFYDIIFEMNDIVGPDETVWYADKRAYRVDAHFILTLDDVPVQWEDEPSQFAELLADSGVGWVVISREYKMILESLDVIFTCLEAKGGDAAVISLDEITGECRKRAMGSGIAKDMLKWLDTGEPVGGKHLIDKRYIFMRWPHIDWYAGLAASLPEMEEEGFLGLHMYNGAGWMYEVEDI